MNKPLYLFAIVLSITIISGIWIFGFDDELFGVVNAMKNTSTDYSHDTTENVSEQQEVISDTIISKGEETTIMQNTVKENLTDSTKAKTSYTAADHSNPKPPTNEELIRRLEKKDFELAGSGIGFQGGPSNAKNSSINLALTPVIDSKLTKFTIKSGSVNYGDSIIHMEDGTLEISGDKVTISLTQDDYLDSIGTFVGTLSGSLLTSRHQTNSVHFENQLLYLEKGARAPIHFIFDSSINAKS